MKYIAYCRKSTDEKDRQVLSIEAQVAELNEFAVREHLEVVDFVTEAKTAKTPGRDKFSSLLKRVEKGEAQGILSWHPDRLARNSVDGGKIIYLLDNGELLDLKFPQFWFDNTPQGKFMLNIAFGQSKYYVDNLSENVKRGIRQKLRNGVWPARAPFGYINDSKTKSIQIDSVKSKVIHKAFEMFSQGGKSFTEISNYLYKFGVTRGWRSENNNPLHVNQIKMMFTNRFYIGILHYDGEYYEASHKTFISKKLFDAVQLQIKRIERPRFKGHNFAFVGLARCGECGCAITGEQHIKKYKNGTSQSFIYYRCTKKIKPCSQKYISEQQLEEQIRGIISKCALHEDWEAYFEKWIQEDLEKEQKFGEENLLKLKLELKGLDRKLNILLDSYLDQVIDSQTYKDKKNEIFEQKLKIQEEITKIKTDGSSWLEPTKNWLGSALMCAKIARAKNTNHDLAIMAKTVGSNLILLNRHLKIQLDYRFATLCAITNAASVPPTKNSISLLVPQVFF